MTPEIRLEQGPADVITAGFFPTRTTSETPAGRISIPSQICNERAKSGVLSFPMPATVGALSNTERLPQSTSGRMGGVVGGLAVAICICAGGDLNTPHSQWHGSSTSLNFTNIPEARVRKNASAKTKANNVHQRLLTAKIGDQTREALAALGITKSQMADILGIQRPHLYAWLADKVERPDKGDRLRDLLKLLLDAGISSQHPLRSHLLTEPLEPGSQPLVATLLGDLNSTALSSALATAQRLNRIMDDEIAQREARMRAAGHKVGTDAEAQATFETTLTMMEWDRS